MLTGTINLAEAKVVFVKVLFIEHKKARLPLSFRSTWRKMVCKSKHMSVDWYLTTTKCCNPLSHLQPQWGIFSPTQTHFCICLIYTAIHNRMKSVSFPLFSYIRGLAEEMNVLQLLCKGQLLTVCTNVFIHFKAKPIGNIYHFVTWDELLGWFGDKSAGITDYMFHKEKANPLD